MSSLVQTFEANTKGRDFVVGDIHGMFDLLDTASIKAGFDTTRDRAFCIGDLINRGGQSERAIHFLRQPWFKAIRGNHEQFFINRFENGLPPDYASSKEGTHPDYKWLFNQSARDIKRLRAAFEKMPVVIELDTRRGPVGLVHAEVPAGLDWETFKQKVAQDDSLTIQTALLGRQRLNGGDETGVPGIGRIFIGHTPQRTGIRRLGNCYYIDTGACYTTLPKKEYLSLTFAEVTASSKDLQFHIPYNTEAVTVILDKARLDKPFSGLNA